MNSHSVILIPAYHPDGKLTALLQSLETMDFRAIVLVDDGSGPDYAGLFREAASFRNVMLLRHSVNMGKGAALKMGLNYIYANLPDVKHVITADSDGQHTPEDIQRLSDAAEKAPESLILGARAFEGDVPFRSRFGNRLTAFLMRFLLGIRITDTQTGLRAIPRSFIPELLPIPYNRYEFELEMLLCAKRMKRAITELPIRTVYIDNNASSHFNPLLDSFKIYIVLFRYILVSIVTAVVDYIVFVPVLYFFGSEVLAVAVGRVAGAAVQYTLVRRVVFSSKEGISSTLPKYAFLVLCSGCASYIIMNSIEIGSGMNAYFAKLAAEVLLYLANFLIQRDFIFQRLPGQER